LIKAVYEAIRNSPIWNTSLLVIVYDEHGGFYDHVKPGCAIPPGDGIPEGQVTRNALGFDFTQYGVRVPAVIVSPLIPRGTVDHTLYDHSSILATLEKLLGMNPLTDRDGSANDLRHLLTNPAPREDCPKTLVSPATASPYRAIFEKEGGDVITVDDEPLPDSGNIIGFLQILLKTELECSQLNGEDEAEQARILENYKKINTKNKAQAYVKYMRNKIEEMKRRAG
jgi:phospholipase C